MAEQTCSTQRQALEQATQAVADQAAVVEELARANQSLMSAWNSAKASVQRLAAPLATSARSLSSVEQTIQTGRNMLAEAIKTGLLTESQKAVFAADLQTQIQRLKEFQARYDSSRGALAAAATHLEESFLALKANSELYAAEQKELADLQAAEKAASDALDECLGATSNAKQNIQNLEAVVADPQASQGDKDAAARLIGNEQESIG